MYSNNIVNFQESMTILNTLTEKVWKLIVCPSYLTLALIFIHWYRYQILIILFNINYFFAHREIVSIMVI